MTSKEQKIPVSINLNGNKLTLSNKGKWEIESSDLDLATFEIERLVTEKEQLASTLEKALNQIELLSQEIREVNQMKAVVLEMLMKERQQRIALENQIEGYQEELRESYHTIFELKTLMSGK